MKLVIAGSRTFTPSMDQIGWKLEELYERFDGLPDLGDIDEIVSGGARGCDVAGEQYARLSGLVVKRFVPDWGKHGRSAGFIRNGEMAAYGDAAIVWVRNESAGATNMIEQMRKRDKPYLRVDVL